MVKILIADDELLCLESLDMIVANVLPNASRISFRSASKALEYIETHPIDLAFLDINMRGISGITIAQELILRNPHVNIIFCTGYEDYALKAWELNSSGYLLKPITEDQVRFAIENLRYPIQKDEKRIQFHCFGNFEAYCDGKPIVFKYRKTKELLAYLVDRNGASCSTAEIGSMLFDDQNHRSYINQIRLDLINTLEQLGIENILMKGHGFLAINRDMVMCDYYDYLDQKQQTEVPEYMSQYSFAEWTLGKLVLNE